MLLFLQVARRKAEVYDKYIAVLKSFLERKSPPPCWADVKLTLESDLIGHHDFDLPREVQEQIEQLSSDSSPDSGMLYLEKLKYVVPYKTILDSNKCSVS